MVELQLKYLQRIHSPIYRCRNKLRDPKQLNYVKRIMWISTDFYFLVNKASLSFVYEDCFFVWFFCGGSGGGREIELYVLVVIAITGRYWSEEAPYLGIFHVVMKIRLLFWNFPYFLLRFICNFDGKGTYNINSTT